MENKTNLDFGKALEALKLGNCIARQGWNGKNMYLFLNIGSANKEIFKGDDPSNNHIEGIRRSMFTQGDNNTTTRLPNINMRSATGSIVTGWLCSQTDMLAEDWCILESGNIQD